MSALSFFRLGCDDRRSREHRERLTLAWRTPCPVHLVNYSARLARRVTSGLMILAMIGFCCFSTTPYDAIDEAHYALRVTVLENNLLALRFHFHSNQSFVSQESYLCSVKIQIDHSRQPVLPLLCQTNQFQKYRHVVQLRIDG
jgi:hypothetical protein